MGNGIQEDAPIVMQLCPKPGQFGFRKGGGPEEGNAFSVYPSPPPPVGNSGVEAKNVVFDLSRYAITAFLAFLLPIFTPPQ